VDKSLLNPNALAAAGSGWQRFFRRAANYFRPSPRYLSLSVSEILQTQASLNVVERFNDLYYTGGTARALHWKGIELLKTPCDLWMVLELMQTLRPSVMVETGTHRGGSALFFSDMAKVLGLPTKLVTVDLNPKWTVDPQGQGIASVVGYSTDPQVFRQVQAHVQAALSERPGAVLVLLDSDHSEANVAKELSLYSSLVTVGSYLVVEDTNVNGHPSFPAHGPGPWEAVSRFLETDTRFAPDAECERFLLTTNPRGWLKRLS
jgi:cephalosporin hydroxylase